MNPHVPHVPSVQGAHGSIVGVEEPVLVREHEADREPHHVARGHEVLRALGDLLAVSLDQMLVDVAHHAVGHGFGAQVEAREPHAHLMQHAFVLKVLAGLPDLEPGEDVARVRAEPVHIRHERVERVVRAEVVEPEAGHVVEGPAGERAICLVLQTPFTLMLLDRLAHGVTGRFQRAFQSPQQGEREDQLVCSPRGGSRRGPSLRCSRSHPRSRMSSSVQPCPVSFPSTRKFTKYRTIFQPKTYQTTLDCSLNTPTRELPKLNHLFHIPEIRMAIQAAFSLLRASSAARCAFLAAEIISLMRLSWLASEAPGS